METITRLPLSHVESVCKIGQAEECCRYLAGDADGLCCLKHHEGFAALLDKRVAEDEIVAQGDNCPGYDGPEPPARD